MNPSAPSEAIPALEASMRNRWLMPNCLRIKVNFPNWRCTPALSCPQKPLFERLLCAGGRSCLAFVEQSRSIIQYGHRLQRPQVKSAVDVQCLPRAIIQANPSAIARPALATSFGSPMRRCGSRPFAIFSSSAGAETTATWSHSYDARLNLENTDTQTGARRAANSFAAMLSPALEMQ